MVQGHFNCQPSAPRVPQQMHLTEPQRLADGLHFTHIARHRPQAGVIRPVGLSGPQLVKGDHPIAVLFQAGVGFAQIVAGQPRPAVEAENGLIAVAELIGHDVIPIHRNVMALIGRTFAPHGLFLIVRGYGSGVALTLTATLITEQLAKILVFRRVRAASELHTFLR